MKFVKLKILIITCIVCLLPILLGIVLWDKLPDTIAVHFNINNEPDNYASKAFAVFGLPCLMMLFQIFCCITSDVNCRMDGEYKNIERVTKWIIPCITIILQFVLFGYALEMNVDIRKIASLIVGTLFIVSGICMTKAVKIKKRDINAEKARKIKRFLSCGSIIMGILSFITVFLPTISTIIWLILLIPYTAVNVIYGIKVGK